MALTPSNMPELGMIAPEFELRDTISHKAYQLSDFYSGEATRGCLIAFVCNHCPYVIHILDKLTELCNQYEALGIRTTFINSNDVTQYPQDGPNQMKKLADEQQFKFPYLFDETQSVAKKYLAACTPDLFLFDRERRLVYRGQFDASRPGNGTPVTGEDLRRAFDSLLSGNPITTNQTASVGCNIKWID